MTARALSLTEKYQVPAIILADQYLLDSLYIIEKEFAVPERIERYIADGDAAAYRRYAVTANGVSPRRLPCRGSALVVANGNEHSEDGHTTEEIAERNKMVHKRLAKIPHMLQEMEPPRAYHGDAQTLLVCWGSTIGAVQEAVDMLRPEGIDCGALHFTGIWPFPAEAAKKALEKAARFFVVENNTTGQIGQLIRQELMRAPEGLILKYDGRPFYPNEIADKVKELVR